MRESGTPALAALVEAWGLPERDWYRDDYDALIEAAKALLGETER